MAAANPLIAGRYQIVRLIGGGATGNVYLGTDQRTGDTVAVKELRIELTGNMPEMVERFLREGEALRRLNHPNIVKVLATAEENHEHYIVMEYVTCGSLADLIHKQPQLPLERILSIALELSDALSRAHHLNILHRDLKPANILLADDGTPRLTDFGLARMVGQPGLTETGSILGTFQYMSPEAVENRQVDERSDIWSFGIVLYEMITGRRPFDGETPFEIFYNIKNTPLPPIERYRQGVPQALCELVKRMLRKDGPARPASVRLVGAELEAIQKEQALIPNKAVGKAPKIKVLIVDDHAVVRQGLRTFIDLQLDMEVIGEGANGQEAVDLAGQLQPDLILLDLVMPEMDGVTATAQIKARQPQTRILILTSFGEDDKVIPAIQAGAQGYLLKNMAPEELLQAVREAHQGKIQLHPEIAAKLFLRVAAAPPAARDEGENSLNQDPGDASSPS